MCIMNFVLKKRKNRKSSCFKPWRVSVYVRCVPARVQFRTTSHWTRNTRIRGSILHKFLKLKLTKCEWITSLRVGRAVDRGGVFVTNEMKRVWNVCLDSSPKNISLKSQHTPSPSFGSRVCVCVLVRPHRQCAKATWPIHRHRSTRATWSTLIEVSVLGLCVQKHPSLNWSKDEFWKRSQYFARFDARAPTGVLQFPNT